MWIQELIKGNFSLLLNTLSKEPLLITTVFFIGTTIFFMLKNEDSRNRNELMQTEYQKELKEIQAVSFDRLLRINDLQMEYLMYKNNVDSNLREKIEKPLNELKTNVDRIN